MADSSTNHKKLTTAYVTGSVLQSLNFVTLLTLVPFVQEGCSTFCASYPRLIEFYWLLSNNIQTHWILSTFILFVWCIFNVSIFGNLRKLDTSTFTNHTSLAIFLWIRALFYLAFLILMTFGQFSIIHQLKLMARF